MFASLLAAALLQMADPVALCEAGFQEDEKSLDEAGFRRLPTTDGARRQTVYEGPVKLRIVRPRDGGAWSLMGEVAACVIDLKDSPSTGDALVQQTIDVTRDWRNLTAGNSFLTSQVSHRRVSTDGRRLLEIGEGVFEGPFVRLISLDPDRTDLAGGVESLDAMNARSVFQAIKDAAEQLCPRLNVIKSGAPSIDDQRLYWTHTVGSLTTVLRHRPENGVTVAMVPEHEPDTCVIATSSPAMGDEEGLKATLTSGPAPWTVLQTGQDTAAYSIASGQSAVVTSRAEGLTITISATGARSQPVSVDKPSF